MKSHIPKPTSHIPHLKTLNVLGGSLVNFIARLASWLAPLPSAYFIAHASNALLGVPAPIALSIALVVELQGLALAHTALSFYRWNRDHNNRAAKWQAPTWIPSLLFAVYLITTWTLTVVLKVWPPGVTYAPGLFPLLALTGTVNLALEASHVQRRHDRRQARQKPPAERKDEQAPAQPAPADLTTLSTVERRLALLELWERGDGQNFAQLAPAFGVARQTLSNDLAHWRALGKAARDPATGRIVVDNGRAKETP